MSESFRLLGCVELEEYFDVPQSMTILLDHARSTWPGLPAPWVLMPPRGAPIWRCGERGVTVQDNSLINIWDRGSQAYYQARAHVLIEAVKWCFQLGEYAPRQVPGVRRMTRPHISNPQIRYRRLLKESEEE